MYICFIFLKSWEFLCAHDKIEHFLVSASEAFFDNLTVEQEFMTGVDTDKVK